MEKQIRWIRCGVAVFLILALALSVSVLAVHRYGLLEGESVAAYKNIESQEEETALSEGDWQYMDGGENPAVGNVWTTGRYDAEGWKAAKFPFAAPGSEESGEGTALVSRNQDGVYAPTYFFRKTFTAQAGQATGITGTIRYSDAVVVYLNGEVIFTGNVPAGGYEGNEETGCAEAPGTVKEETFSVSDLDSLADGENVLAIELHQAEPSAEKAFLDLTQFRFTVEEEEAPAPQIDGVFLEVGENEDQIFVNAFSDSAGSLEIGYIPESDWEKYSDAAREGNAFVQEAARAFMGRTYDKARKCYRYRAPLDLLRKGETYLYQIRCVGNKNISAIMQYEFSSSGSYTFAVHGSAHSAGAFWGSGEEKPQFAVMDRALVQDGAGSMEGIPLCLLGEPGSRSFCYGDVLFLVPDPGDTLEQRKTFIQAERKHVKRKWTVVLLDEEDADGQEAAFAGLGVDLTVNAASKEDILVQVTDRALTPRSVPSSAEGASGQKEK